LSVSSLTGNYFLANIMDNLIKRIAWAIETIKLDKGLDKGIKDVDLAKILGTNKNTLAEYRQQRGLIKGEVIEKIVHHYHFNPMWLFYGAGEPFPGARDRYPDFCGHNVSTFQTIPVQPDFPSEDFVLVRQFKGKISAGLGLVPNDAADLCAVFRKDWITRKGKPDQMSLIKVSGDSMEPTLLDGDLVLVDHSRNHGARQGGIYAIVMDEEIMIKRLQALPQQDTIRIISDNKHYPPLDVSTSELRINGRVIWFARELER
jgi:phage repressor protein C with HTH and peptisase S24 domain